MDTNTDKQSVLAALPQSFPPIENPPGWTKSTDLELYLAAQRPVGAPVLPVGATVGEAYEHALGLVASARTELATGIAVRANYNAGLLDAQLTRELMARPWSELVERLRAVDNAQAATNPNTEEAAEVQKYIDGQADEALFLNDEQERLLDRHAWQPGSTSLCELNELANRLGDLACASVENYWHNEVFANLFEEVAAPLRGTETGSLYLYTSPTPGSYMQRVWRLA